MNTIKSGSRFLKINPPLDAVIRRVVILAIAGLFFNVMRGGAVAETTFLANYNATNQTGNARFTPDHKVGSGFIIYSRGTAGSETRDLPAGTLPSLNSGNRMEGGAASLEIRGGRDYVSYQSLSTGTVNRAQGTAEGFFRTPWLPSQNSEPRAFLSAWVSFTDGKRWYWEMRADSTNYFTVAFGDNSSGGKSLTLQSLPISAADWPSNQWKHVAVTWQINPGVNDDRFQLFLDGRLIGLVANGDFPVTSSVESANGHRVYVGVTSSGTGTDNSATQGCNLEGWVESVRLDNAALYDGTSHNVGDAVFMPPAAEAWRGLKVFQSAATVWQRQGTTPDQAVLTAFDNRTQGWEFPCNFSNVTQQCYWIAATSLSLSNAVSINSWGYVSNAASILWMNLYFRSGTGWYRSGYRPGEGWNNFSFNLDQAAIEGTPAGLGSIDMAQVSVKKQPNATGRATVALYDVEASALRAEDRAFEYPEYDFPLPRLVRVDPSTGARQESRAIFDETILYRTNLSTEIGNTLNRVQQAGFNVYSPCVWEGRGTLYPPQFNAAVGAVTVADDRANLQGPYDPIADLIQQAHARGIEVHPWFTIALRYRRLDGTLPYPQYAEPGVPNLGYAFDLQHPGFRDFIVTEIVNFANRYDVDGINLDYIRTIGTSFTATASNIYSQVFPGHNIQELQPLTMTEETRTNRFLPWQRDAVSNIVQRVSAGIKTTKPWVVISADGVPKPKPVLDDQGRNEWLWVEKDYVDVLFNMDYARIPNAATLEMARVNSLFQGRYAEVIGNYDILTNGSILPRDPQLVNRQMDYVLRKFPERGAGVFFYGGLSDAQIGAWGSGVFAANAIAYFDLQNNSLPVFSSHSTTWTKQAATTDNAIPISISRRNMKGWQFPCNFAAVTDRCYWDAATNLNLSSVVSFTGSFYVSNAPAIGYATLHFRSGSAGWYSKSFALSEGWNNIRFDRDSALVQGTPIGWNQVDLIRWSIWKASNGVSAVNVNNVKWTY